MRGRTLRRALALAGTALIISTTAVYADQVTVDNDLASAGNQNVFSQTVAPGATVNQSVQIKVAFQGGGNHLSINQNLTFVVNAAATNLPAGYSAPNIVVAIGGTWTTNSVASASQTVSFTAPASGGPFNYTIDYDLSGSPSCVSLPANCLGGNPVATLALTLSAPVNQAPVVDAGGDYSGDEGSDIGLDGGSATDSDGTIASTLWEIVDDSGVAPGGCSISNATSLLSATINCTDNGSATVRLTATDDDGASTSDTATVNVANVAPSVNTFTCPTDPVAVNTEIALTGTYSDPGSADTHTASIAWGDGSSSAAAAASGSASGSHIYTAAGIYSPILTVTDDDGESGSLGCMYVVVYDPSAGFVTGGGWIWSPAGAYADDLGLEGKATFGFVSKYKKGATIPEGNTEFQFHAAGMNFKSTSYQWLVVSGSKATYKGFGTLNGVSGYGFLLSAKDGSPDMFRIKIWEVASGDVVYDNNLANTADDADPATAISGGSIVIHK